MKHVKALFITLIVIGLVIFIGYRFYLAYLPKPVRIQGQIEARQYTISSKVAGRIDQVFVKKGQQLKQGDPVFTILSPEIEAKLDQAIANKDAASAMAEQSQTGARIQEINAASDQWKKAQAATQLMEKTYQRVQNLYQDGVVAEQKRDEALTQWEAAKYTESAALQMYQMTKEGARSETKVAAAEKVKMAEGVVSEIRAYEKDTKIKSWFDGEVSQVLLNSGELAPQGFPVVTVVDMQDVWAVFNVREDSLNQFTKGQRFTAYLPALKTSIEFEVIHVAVMGDFATWRTTDASQGFDLRTFEVEAKPINSTEQFRVGMSVIVEL
ncbi:efflux RND transporter periplasmic adaptor subunit [Psychromonas sp.]|nr:efflux RND transporter periplasmic adaptor subunit [Psychromonas sp.]